MMRTLVLAVILVFLPAGIVAQTQAPPSPAELAEIAARGSALVEYDQVAWHASDAVEGLHPARGTAKIYVGRKMADGWTMVWGRFDDSHSRLLIFWEAKQIDGTKEYKVVKHDPPVEDGEFYFHAALALETGTKEFAANAHPQSSFNFSVIPAPATQWYVYAIPGSSEAAMLPYGADVRYTISADGTKILERRQMHKSLIQDSPNTSAKDQYFHSHVLSNIPEDSDLFYAFYRRMKQGEWIATSKYVYEISPQLAFRTMGATADLARQLEAHNCSAFRDEDLCSDGSRILRLRLMVLFNELSDQEPVREPVLMLAELQNARCQSGDIWMTLHSYLENRGDKPLVFYRGIRNSVALRLADTRANLDAGKFDPLVFVAADESDYSKEDSYVVLEPGMRLSLEKELLLAGTQLEEKKVVELLFLNGISGGKNLPAHIRERFGKQGEFYMDDVFSQHLMFELDPRILSQCGAK